MKQKTEKYSNLVHKCTVFEYFSVFLCKLFKTQYVNFYQTKIAQYFHNKNVHQEIRQGSTYSASRKCVKTM